MSTASPLIVLAEDNSADVYLVHEALRQHGLCCEVISIDDGEEVLTFIDGVDGDLARPAPNLFVVDLNLPKRSGDEILEHLRKSTRCATVPVVVISSSDSPHDRNRVAQVGAVYFCKPADLDKFLSIGEVIRDQLARNPNVL